MVNSVKETIPSGAIEAAFAQFDSTGEISMRKVASALNVTATALYHHFEDKQDLLNAVAERAFRIFDRQLRSIESRQPELVIRGILGEYRKFAQAHPHLFGLMFVEPQPAARKFPRDFAAHRAPTFNLLWKAVEDLVSDNADGASDDPLYLAHDLWALAHGMILLRHAGRFENDVVFQQSFDRSIEHFISRL
jgi:AcrR family transcriptional regulator